MMMSTTMTPRTHDKYVKTMTKIKTKKFKRATKVKSKIFNAINVNFRQSLLKYNMHEVKEEKESFGVTQDFGKAR